MKVLYTGGREFGRYSDEAEMVFRSLEELGDDTVIIQGGASGLDRAAANIARQLGFKSIVTFPAQWKKYGRSAGIRRNMEMLDTTKPDIVYAFPGGTGTAHMVAYARRQGVPVRFFPRPI